jgi:arylsulfatase A-like enzyme
MLERKGALDNAILVILSDHGEALALPGDAMLSNASRIEGLRVPITVVDAGHGQSVLSPVQYQVLLAFRSFGRAAGFEARGRSIAGGATVEDIAPTLLDLLGVPGDPLSANGEAADRVRYTETDLKVLPDAKDGVDEVGTAKQNSVFFEVVPATARLQVREKYVPLVISFKERAAFTEKLLLAALPVGPDAHTYLLIDKATSNGRVLMGPPENGTAERALWDAMTGQFAGELKSPVSITFDQLPDVDRAWMNFFLERDVPLGDAGAVSQ